MRVVSGARLSVGHGPNNRVIQSAKENDRHESHAKALIGATIAGATITGDQATQATAAAQASVPDGAVERVETGAERAAFEAHMVKADGSHVAVKLNSVFAVASVEDGMRASTATSADAT